jgi:hypothetical protein
MLEMLSGPKPQGSPGDWGAWPPLVGRSELDAALHRYGLSALPAAAGSLRIPAGTELVLDPAAGLPFACRTLATSDIAEFKSWIGVPDELAVPLGELPDDALTGPVRGRADFSPAAWRDLRRAAHQYLFGDSRPVASYRALLEQCFGPFEATLWLADRIVIEPGAALVVRHRPTVLLARELELHAGGRICLHSVASLTLGSLRKIELPVS